MKLGRILFQRLAGLIDHYSLYHPQPLSIKTLVDFGSKTGHEKRSFEFLRQELLVRLANIMKEIKQFSDPLSSVPSINMVKSWYDQSFCEIVDFERADPQDPSVLAAFSDTLVKIRNRHSCVVETMAQGMVELKHAQGQDLNTEQIQYFLDRFYMNRISIRMLINQHATLYGNQLNSDPQHIGCIHTKCDVLEVVRDAYADARFLCENFYLTAPDVDFTCIDNHEKSEQIQLTCVPSHLHHMLFELFKNSMRAVVEKHGNEYNLPQLKVTICKGRKDLTIKLSDQGGGIPHRDTEKLFKYMYTTAPEPTPYNNRDGSAPLAGYGYGLPLSRLYARYFNGDLMLIPIEGHGMDAIIYQQVVLDEANESLPVYNTTAARMYENDVVVSDWSSSQPWTQNPSSRSFSTNTARAFSTRARRFSSKAS